MMTGGLTVYDNMQGVSIQVLQCKMYDGIGA